MSQEIEILLVDDDEVDRMAVKRALGQTSMPVSVREVTRSEDAMRILAESPPDAIFLDHYLPDETGLELTKKIRAAGHDLPIVALTGRGDETLAVELMKAGVSDYLGKQDLSAERLGQSLRYVLAMHRAERRAERAQAALRENRQWLAASLRSIGDAVVTTDGQGEITYLNPAAEELTGWTQGEASGRDLRQVLRLEGGAVDRALAMLHEDQPQEGDRQTHQSLLTTRDGNEIPVDVTASPLRGDEGGRPRGVVVAIRDVSAKRAAEETLREYAVRLQNLAKAGLDIISSPVGGILQVVTDRARELIGCRIAVTSFSQSGWRQAIHAVSVADERYRQDVEATTPVDSDIYTLVCETNRPVRLSQAELEAHPAWASFERCLPHRRAWLAAPLVGPDGKNLGMIQLSDPFEEHFDAQDEAILLQLAQLASVAISNARLFDKTQEALKARDYVLAVVSHDLRNPLNAVVTNAHLLKRTLEGPNELRWAEAIERSSQRMKELLDDLLQASRFAFGETIPLEPEPLQIEALLEEIRDTLRGSCQERGVGLETRIETSNVRIEADGNRLVQVLNNLVANAVQVSSEGDTVYVAVTDRDGRVRFAVEDEGPGLDPAELEHLFEPFRQSEKVKTGASGLGLAIARGIVHSHGGRIWAENREEGGARFSFEIPERASATP